MGVVFRAVQAAGAGGGQSLGVSGAFVASLLISPLKSWGWVWRLSFLPLSNLSGCWGMRREVEVAKQGWEERK